MIKTGGAKPYLQAFKQGGAVLAIFAFISLPWLTPLAQGASLDTLQQQKQSASQKADEYAAQAKQKAAEVDEIAALTKKIAADISALQGKINSTQRKITDTENEISQTEAQIKEKEAQLASNQKKQTEAIQVMYLMGRESTFETLLTSDSLSEVVARDQYISALEEKIEALMREIKHLKKELEDKKASLEKRRQELQDLRGQLEVQKQGLQEQQATQQRLLSDAKSEMSRLKALQVEQSRIETQVEAEIQAQLARLRAGERIGRGSGVKVNKGDIIGYEGSTGNSTGPHVHFEVIVASSGSKVNPRGYVPDPFRWPLDNFRVTQEYGPATCTVCGYSFHSGIDLADIMGAPVRAGGSGEIILDQYYGGYGNAVIIDHDNGYWTLYGHMTGS